MKLAIRKEPAYLECIHNRDYTITWDSDRIVFIVDSPQKYVELANLNERAKEILLWSPDFDFQCAYIGYEDEWEIFDAI